MEDQKSKNDTQNSDIARRDFVALSVAAGIGVTAGSAEAAGLEVVESNVDIKTPDGTCDAAFFHPRTGTYPGVLIWTDIFGLRPAYREMAQPPGCRRIFRAGAESLLSLCQSSGNR